MGIVQLSRRGFVLGAPLALAACVEPVRTNLAVVSYQQADNSMYGDLDSERFPVAAIDTTEIDPALLRQTVAYDGNYAPGTIIVDPNAKFLYHVRSRGTATRYGVGVGREGFGWSGNARVARKADWPTWVPPTSMIKRRPDLQQYAGGMPGGPENPLGARAMYLYQGDRDTLYRLHGTNEPESIGQSLSSGCIRLFNHDIIDLHSKTALNTQVVVLPNG